MKVFIVILACIGAAMAQSAASKSLENTLNGLKEKMPCGFPDMGVPPMAPLRMDYLDMDQKLWIIKIHGAIQNLVVSGITDYTVSDVNMNVLQLKASFRIVFNSVRVTGRLSLQSWIISFLKIKNNGNLDLSAHNLGLTVSIRFGMVDGLMRIMSLEPQVSLDSVDMQSTGFTLLSLTMKAVNAIAKGVVMNIFNKNREAIEQTMINIVVPAADDYLKDMTITELLKMLTGPKEEGDVCIPPHY